MLKDSLGEAFEVIEQAAPALSAIIGSPSLGTALYFILPALSSAFGIKNKNVLVNSNHLEELKNAILNDPKAKEILINLDKSLQNVSLAS